MDAVLDTPKPAVARLPEAIAAILDLDDGRLDLVFRHGRLEGLGRGWRRAASARAGPLRRRRRPAARPDRRPLEARSSKASPPGRLKLEVGR
jgi:hypothetical protein